jgi:hypothetical protein
MFLSEIYHNFQTARKQKTLSAAAGFRTRDPLSTVEALSCLEYAINYECARR